MLGFFGNSLFYGVWLAGGGESRGNVKGFWGSVSFNPIQQAFG